MYKLDNYQNEAVKSPSINIMVSAAPGSGKTTIIVNRIIRLIKEYNVNPLNILVLTFTKSAALNMSKRYKDLVSTSCNPLFSTFHSLYYKIIKEMHGRVNIIEDTKTYSIICASLKKYFDNMSDEKIKQIINNISLYKCSMCDINTFTPTIDKEIFKYCLNKYEEFKCKNNLFDFDDIEIICMKLLNDKKILSYYKTKFKYILVDEFQDCNEIQVNMLKLLSYGNSIFAVGDEDQSIYGFRGARPDYMVNFKENFKGSEIFYLSINYRSPKNIVAASQKLIRFNKNRNNKEIISFKKNINKVNLIIKENESEQVKEIINKINLLNKELNYSLKDNIILYRTNSESRIIIDLLIINKVPFQILGEKCNFFDNSICKDLVAYFKLSMDNTDTESFIRIINKPFRYISKINLERLKRNKFKEDCFQFIEQSNFVPVWQMKNLSKLKKLINKLKTLSPERAVDFAIKNIGYDEYIDKCTDAYNLDKNDVLQIINEFKNSASNFTGIDYFLKHVKKVDDEIKSDKYKNTSAEYIFLSTIHGVKGMEFKNVFIANCVEKNIPYFKVNNYKNDEVNVEEERRLFYVAITRTIDNLWICIPKNLRGLMCFPSRFLKECDFLCPNNV